MTAKITLAIGQSNMVQAHTSATPFPGGWVADPGIKIWFNPAAAWQTYIPGVNSHDENASAWGFPSGYSWGPEAEFCRQRRIAFPAEEVWLIKQAKNGAGVFPFGDAVTQDFSPFSINGKQFHFLCKQAIPAIKAIGAPAAVDTCIMLGGETDAILDHGPEFRFNFLELDRAIRTEFDAPEMKMVMARIMPYWDPANNVRDHIVAMGSKPNFAWANIDDVETRAPFGDPGHIGINGTKEVGRRLWLARAGMI